MIRRQLAVFAVTVACGAIFARGAPPKSDWKLSTDQADDWAKRIRKLAPDEGWAVTVRGNDIVIQRKKPVRFVQAEINAPAAETQDVQPKDLREGYYRLTLRFDQKLSLDEYEKMAAANDVSAKERERLAAQTRLTQKFGEFIATTPEEKARLEAFREAEAKLVWHVLPDLYSPDHSIHLLRSWGVWSSVYDKDVAHECQEVLDSVLRYFGMYDPVAAAGRIDSGSPEP